MDTLASVPTLVGGFVEGISLSSILFGITISQFYIYAQNWGRDTRWIRVLAILILLLEILYTVLAQRVQYFYSILAIGNPSTISNNDWSIPVIFLLEVFTELAVRGFYIYRIWLFSKNIPLVSIMIACVLAWAALFIVCMVDIIMLKSWSSVEHRAGFRPSLISSWAVVTCTDLLIGITMFHYLYSHRKQSRATRTRGILSSLMLYFVGTGLVMAALSASIVIVIIVIPENFVWGGLVVLYDRALANSFYGALNIRENLRNRKCKPITLGGTPLGNTSYTSRKHTKDYSTPIEIMKTVVVDTGGDIPLDLEHCRLET